MADRRSPGWLMMLLSAVVGAAAALAVISLQPHEPPPQEHDSPAPEIITRDFSSSAPRILPSVVSITAEIGEASGAAPPGPGELGPDDRRSRPDPFQDPDETEPMPTITPVQTLGSGWVCRADGFIATNYHIVDDARRVTVRLLDTDAPETVVAEVWGADERTDTAVLKVEVDRALPALSLAEIGDAGAGDSVMAVGTPFGLDGSISAGVVSAARRALPVGRDGQIHDVIQIDAMIRSGSSGGPLVDRNGRLIGMIMAVSRWQDNGSAGNAGYGFAIPARTLRHVIADLIEHRRVRWASFGCAVAPLSANLRDFYAVSDTGGALVTVVDDQSPAAEAGIAVDDVIISFGDSAVRNPADLRAVLVTAPPRESRAVEVMRDGRRMQFEVTLGEEPSGSSIPQEPAGSVTSDLGLTVEAAERRFLADEGLQQAEGVVVKEVKAGAVAERIVRHGDLILKVNGTAVTDEATFARLVQEALASDRTYLVLHIHRRILPTGTRIIVTDIPMPSSDDPDVVES